MTCHLQGLSVLVTRPREQADALCERIEQAGGRPVRFPVMEIVPLEDLEPARRVLAQAEEADLMIFISANAVRHAFPLLPEVLPADLKVAAVGQATARALEELGLAPDLVPEGCFDSEGLLALPRLQEMSGRRVIIVRGEGGRETLRKKLEARGAEVVYAELYRRRCSERSAANLLAQWERMVQAVVVTSVAVFDCLWKLLGEEGQKSLRETPLVVLSERIANHARQLGCRQVAVTDQANDTSILESLCRLVETP